MKHNFLAIAVTPHNPRKREKCSHMLGMIEGRCIVTLRNAEDPKASSFGMTCSSNGRQSQGLKGHVTALARTCRKLGQWNVFSSMMRLSISFLRIAIASIDKSNTPCNTNCLHICCFFTRKAFDGNYQAFQDTFTTSKLLMLTRIEMFLSLYLSWYSLLRKIKMYQKPVLSGCCVHDV